MADGLPGAQKVAPEAILTVLALPTTLKRGYACPGSLIRGEIHVKLDALDVGLQRFEVEHGQHIAAGVVLVLGVVVVVTS